MFTIKYIYNLLLKYSFEKISSIKLIWKTHKYLNNGLCLYYLPTIPKEFMNICKLCIVVFLFGLVIKVQTYYFVRLKYYIMYITTRWRIVEFVI